MGEVYRAKDTKLNREVALKVLPDTLAGDPDRLARFRREAQVLASLNHPNIAHVHGFEDAGAVHALVMELVEGPTLADRIAQGPIPLGEALPIARQIADALECAHVHGIIHRDLKPANIKVRTDGTVKVLDFGLAKAMDPTGGTAASAMNSPTLSMRATQAGLILGTAAYMSPEQAAGKSVDARSDLWSFGVVLLEMLTARQTFDGETVSHVLAAVLTKEPDWGTLPANTPGPIRRLLRRCLDKDRKRRLDSAAAARLEIDDALTSSPLDLETTHTTTDSGRRTGAVLIVPWAIAVAAVLTAAALAWRGSTRETPTPVYATLDAPADHVFGDDDAYTAHPTRTPMVFTPDGRALIVQAARTQTLQLFLRSLDRPDARPIAGTDGARVPFVSPDGKWIGFWAANELRKVPIEGGVSTTICPLPGGALGPFGVVWGPGDVIVFGDVSSGRIMRVPASGGTPTPVTAAPAITSRRRHVWPALLPDGRRVLFSDVSTIDASDARVMVQALDGGEPKLVLASATDARLLPSGRLAFMRLGTLMTVPFDVSRAQTTGDAVGAMSSVMQAGTIRRAGGTNPGPGMFAVSSPGALAVIRGSLTGPPSNSLDWVARDGRLIAADPSLGAPAGTRMNVRISPDGSRALVAIQTPMRMEVWLADWTRDVWTACGECASELGITVWAPDGRRVLISRNGTLVVHALDGSSPDQPRLHEDDRSLIPMAWRADGRVVYLSSPDLTRYEIKLLEPGQTAGRVLVPLGEAEDADVSPDGRWLAYNSRHAGQLDVMVQAFPGPGPRTAVSVGRAQNPRWSPDGRTLYYLSGPSLFPVDVASAGELKAGKPRELFQPASGQACSPAHCYDLSANGQRFLFHSRLSSHEPLTRMDLVLNWTATLKGQ